MSEAAPPTPAAVAEDATTGLHASVLMVDDGMRGGVRRVSEYLIEEWRSSEGGPSVERIPLRGEGALRASLPIYLRGLAQIAARMVVRRPAVIHLNVTQRGSTWRSTRRASGIA